MKKKMILSLMLLTLVLSSVLTAVFSEPALIPKNVLILHSDEEFMPANIDVNSALVGRLKASTQFEISIYSEYMDPNRIYDAQQMEDFTQQFRKRYTQVPPDVIIAIDFKAYTFLTTTVKDLVGDTPLVFCLMPEGLIDESTLPPSITGNYLNIDSSGTVDVIMHMHPGTQEIVVISGAGTPDLNKEKIVIDDLTKNEPPVPVTYISGMTMDDMMTYVSRLPQGSIILYNAIFEDANGDQFIPREALRMLNRVSSVPIYGIIFTNMEYGLVGGSLFEFQEVAFDTADKTLSILSGVPPSALPIEKVKNKIYMNWTFFNRWGISVKDIPEDAILVNQVFTPWELYRGQIIGTIVLIIVLSSLLFYALMQLRQKQIAQKELQVLNEGLEDIVASRTEELEASNTELQTTNSQLQDEIENRMAIEQELTATLESLHSTQQQLVSAEKQAVVHHLVRNLLHRVNTPLGTSLSYIDLLRHQIENDPAIVESEVKEDELFIIKSLHKSQDKIKSTMDTLKAMLEIESDEAFHAVYLKQFILDILAHNPVQEEGDDTPIMLFCYPDKQLSIQTSSFKAAIENLIAYAKISRLHNKNLPPAELSVLHVENGLEMVYQDEALGKGENIENVFDPYAFNAFKTDPSGLELVILYNHITIGMSGSVTLDTRTNDEGVEQTVIKMRIPLKRNQEDLE